MSNLAATNSPFFIDSVQRDLIAELLSDKRSLNTQRAYARDLKAFFRFIAKVDPTPELVAQFLTLERATALKLVLGYKANLISQSKSENTVNRAIASIKSLVKFAQLQTACEWSLEEIRSEKVRTYRDTTGVKVEDIRKMLAIPDRTTIKGLRDYAILRLLWDNALRRGEVAKTNVGDFEPELQRLAILGKGRGTQKEFIELNESVVAAIAAWLAAREQSKDTDPLFTAVDRHRGHRLSGGTIYKIVKKIAEAAGLTKRISPHRWRHSSITAALDATDGNVRKVRKLSRHSKIDTLLIYDDARLNAQGEISGLLGNLVED